MSNVVSSVIMIALVIAAVAVVWGVVRPMVQENLETAGSCQDVLGKIEIDNRYTCYDSTNDKFYFMIQQGAVEDVNKMIVSISAGVETLSKEIPGDDSVVMCSGTGTAELPGKNSGKTYYINVTSEVNAIGVTPEVGGKQCNTVDSISDVRSCTTMLDFDDLKEACGTGSSGGIDTCDESEKECVGENSYDCSSVDEGVCAGYTPERPPVACKWIGSECVEKDCSEIDEIDCEYIPGCSWGCP